MDYPSRMRPIHDRIRVHGRVRALPFACLAVAALALAACSEDPPPPKPAPGKAAVSEWPLPGLPGSAQPDLALTVDGRIMMTWLDSRPGRRPAMQIAPWHPDTGWERTRTVAVGNALFVNWADTPHVAATDDRALWAHWLQKSGEAPYAYDVMLSRSMNGGASWSPPVRPHDDGTLTEHGFVSLWPMDEGRIGVAWLDGRNTAGAGHDGHAAAGQGAAGQSAEAHGAGAHADSGKIDGGAMTLRAAVFDRDLRKLSERELDATTCDCCQTDAVAMAGDDGAAGALLVYRDRATDAGSGQDIRDIYAVRFDGERWSDPVRVHADDWKMPACPVNGPAVAALGEAAVVAWYTATDAGGGDGAPRVRLARSADGGRSFAAPVEVDAGAAVQGRVAVALDERQAWVLWLREEAGRQSLWLARYEPDLSAEIERIKLSDVQGMGRGTGFPRLLLRGDTAYVVWTDVVDGVPQLAGRVVEGG